MYLGHLLKLLIDSINVLFIFILGNAFTTTILIKLIIFRKHILKVFTFNSVVGVSSTENSTNNGKVRLE